MVRDPQEIYHYMEENKIGINEPEYWTSRLLFLVNTCMYDEFAGLLKKINGNRKLSKYSHYLNQAS